MLTVCQKKMNTPFIFNTNYLMEMKFVPINTEKCLLSFDGLKFPLVGRLHGGSLLNFIFFNETPKFDNEILKITVKIG